MYSKKYNSLAFFNLIFGVCAICLYLPYTLSAFNIKGFGWLDFAKNILKSKYFDVMVYFGIFLLIWIIALTVISLPCRINLSKLLFKLSTIVALALPLIYVLSIKYDFALEFWIKNIASNIKMISYVLLCVSGGCFILGIMFNFTRDGKANLHQILQALAMCVLLAVLIAVNGWCGWKVNVIKLFGVLMGVFAIYLPISSIVLMLCAKNRD